MTLDEIRGLLTGADPGIRHYYSKEKDRDYSFWEETRRLPFTADGRHQEGWTFYVHRFTRDEHDPTASALFDALDADPRTTVIHTTDFEPDSGYIHHIFQCEGY